MGKKVRLKISLCLFMTCVLLFTNAAYIMPAKGAVIEESGMVVNDIYTQYEGLMADAAVTDSYDELLAMLTDSAVFSVGFRDDEETDYTNMRVFLLPYTTERSLAGYANACNSGQCFEVSCDSRTIAHVTDYSQGTMEYYEYTANDCAFIYNSDMSDALASGVYMFAVTLPEYSTQTAKLFMSRGGYRFSSIHDGGYISDEAYGYAGDPPTDVEVAPNVYIDGELYMGKELDITVFDDKYHCYGAVPCTVPIDEEILIRVVPDESLKEWTYLYKFPTEREDYIRVKVPEDGRFDVSIISYDMNSSLSGYVRNADGEPLRNVNILGVQSVNGYNCVSGTTNANGYYRIEGLYDYAGIDIRIDEPDYLAYHEYMTPDMVYGECSKDIELTEREKLFSFTLNYSADEVMINSIFKAVNSGEISYHVEDMYGMAVGGTLESDDYKSFSFYSNKEYNEAEQFGLTIEMGLLTIPETVVSAGEAATIECIPYSGYSFTTEFTEERDIAGFLFTEDGSLAVKEAMILTAEASTISLYAPAGIYTFVALENVFGISESIHEYADLSRYMPPESWTEQQIALEAAGSILEGGLIVIPANTIEAVSLADLNSWINVPKEIPSDGQYAHITGHVESNVSSEMQVMSLTFKVYAKDMEEAGVNRSSFNKSAGIVAEDSFVIAGTQVNGTAESNTYRIELDNIKAPFDYSCRIIPFIDINVKVDVSADVIINGVEYLGQHVASGVMKGAGVSITAPAKTATGSILCSGYADAGQEVYIYSEDTLVGQSVADTNGIWETYVHLSGIDEAVTRCFSLTAVCNAKSSAPVSVIYSSDSVVVGNIYLCYEGERLEKTYTWTANDEYSCEAVLENTDSFDGVLTFHVLCSNGTIVDLDGYMNDEVRYVSNSYPFGVENLVPIRIWVSFGSETQEEYMERDGAILVTQLMELDQEEVDNAFTLIEAKRSNGILTEEENAASVGTNYALLRYEASTEEMAAIISDYTHHTKAYSDDGVLLYDIFYIQEANTDIYAYIDYRDNSSGTGYVMAGVFYDKDNYPEVFKTITQAGAEPEGFAKINLPPETRRVKHEDMFGFEAQVRRARKNEIIKNDVPTFLQYVYEKIMEKYGQEALGKVDVFGAIMAVKGASDAINANMLADIELAEQLDELYFMRKVAERLDITDADMTRTLHNIDNAINSTIDARELYNSQLFTVLSTTCATYAGGYAGPLAGGVSAVGGLISGLVTDDMLVQADIVKRGSYGDLLDAKLSMLKATGMTGEDYAKYRQMYDSGADILQIRNRYLNDIKENAAGKEYEIFLNPLIDPSGYVYEAVSSNRIEGAAVTLYTEGIELWNAGEYGQANPLITDVEGRYAWDVPEGNWYVEAAMFGYEENNSEGDPAATVSIDGINYLPVLPPQLDVNIGLTSFEKPRAELTYENGAYILSFSRYIWIESMTDDISILHNGNELSNGSDYEITPVNMEISPLHTPYCGGYELASEFRIAFANTVLESDELILTVGYNTVSYSQTSANQIVRVNERVVTEAPPEPEITEELQPTEVITEAPDNITEDDSDRSDDEREVWKSNKSNNGKLFIIIPAAIVALAAIAGIIIYTRKQKKSDRDQQG